MSPTFGEDRTSICSGYKFSEAANNAGDLKQKIPSRAGRVLV